MAAPAKLTDADVKRIRRRVRAGEHQTALADEFGVSRKTIRRRLDALELAEAERSDRIAKRGPPSAGRSGKAEVARQ